MATPAQQPTQTPDLFSTIKEGHIPDNIKSILRSQGKNVSALEKQFKDSVAAGGEAKNNAVQQYYQMFDKIGGTTKYKNILDSYLAQSAAPTAPVTEPQEIAPAAPGQPAKQKVVPSASPNNTTPDTDSGFMDGAGGFFRNLYNSIVPTMIKGVGQEMLAGVTALRKGGNELADVIGTKSPLEVLIANAKIDRDVKKISQEGDKKIDDFLGIELSEADKSMPLSYDREKGKLEWTKTSDLRSWANLFGSGLGSMSAQLAMVLATKGRVGSVTGLNKLGRGALSAMSFQTSTMQMLPGYLKEGLDNGLNYGEAIQVAAPLAMVNGAVEQLGMDKLMDIMQIGKPAASMVVRDIVNNSAKKAIKQFAAKEITLDQFQDAVMETAKRSIKDFGNLAKLNTYKAVIKAFPKTAGTTLRNALPESIEEGWQGANEFFAKELFNTFAATKGAKAGDGRFDNNGGEAIANGIMGMTMGGILGGGQVILAPNSQFADQTLFSYANADIRNQMQNGVQALPDILGNGRIFSKIEEWKSKGAFDVKENGLTRFDQEAYDQVVANANMIYKTAYDFRNFKDFNDLDRYNMFKIAKTRQSLTNEAQKLNQVKEQVAVLDQQIQDPESIEPDVYGNVPSLEMLEIQRDDMVKSLGNFDEEAGLYENEKVLQERTGRINNVIKQAVPAINDSATRRAGRHFLNNGIAAIEALSDPGSDDFVPKYEVKLPDGGVALVSEATSTSDAQVRRLVVDEIPGSDSIVNQIGQTAYKPIDRYAYRNEPIEDFTQFQEAVSEKNGQDLARDFGKSYSVATDAQDLIKFATEQIQAAAAETNPAIASKLPEAIDNAFYLYEQVAAHKDAQNEGVVPMTRDDFEKAIGYTTVEDPMEATILAKQDQLGRPFSVENEYVASDSTINALNEVDAGNENVPIATLNNAIKELNNMRRRWSNMKSASGRMFTIPQIREMVEAIESDMELLANERSFQEAPELRPAKEETAKPAETPAANAETETTNETNETTDGQGSTVDTAEPPTIESEYTEERELAEVIGPSEEQANQLRSELESANQIPEDTEDGRFTEEYLTRIAEQIESINREIESEYGQTEETIAALSDTAGTEPGDSSDSQEGNAETSVDENTDEKPVVKVKKSKKGKAKQSRAIKNPERLKALAKFPDSIREEVYQYFIANGQVSSLEVQDLVKGSANTERQNMVGSTSKNGQSIQGLAHQLWEESAFGGIYTTEDYREEIEDVLLGWPGIKAMYEEMNAVEEQPVDPEFTPEDNEAFEDDRDDRSEDVKALQRDDVPFKQSQIPDLRSKLTYNQLVDTINLLTKAFPNVPVYIPETVQQYYDQIEAIYGPQNGRESLGHVSGGDGAVYLNPENIQTKEGIDTAIHEFGHIWVYHMKNAHPEIYKRGIDLVKNSPYATRIRNSKFYANLNEEKSLEEALVTAIGNKGADFVTTAKKTNFQQWIDSVFEKIKELFGLTQSPKQIADMNFEEFVLAAAKQMLSGEKVAGINGFEVTKLMEGLGPNTTLIYNEDVKEAQAATAEDTQEVRNRRRAQTFVAKYSQAYKVNTPGETRNDNRMAEFYGERLNQAKSEYQEELEKNLEDLREAYTSRTSNKRQQKRNAASKSKFALSPEIFEGWVKDSKARVSDMIQQYKSNKAELRSALPRERGANFLIEKLSRAARNGDVDQKGAELAIDLISKNREIFEDLAISITQAPEASPVQGYYDSGEALVKIFKNTPDPLTAVHELLHHTERFLPMEVREKIMEEWSAAVDARAVQLNKALKGETNPQARQKLTTSLLYLALAQARQAEPNGVNAKDMEAVMFKYLGAHKDSKGVDFEGIGDEFYQLFNPSEWWAVNGSQMLADNQNKPEARTWIEKAMEFYNNLVDSIISIFKTPKTRAVAEGLKAIVDRKTLSDRQGTQMSVANRQYSAAPGNDGFPPINFSFGARTKVDFGTAPGETVGTWDDMLNEAKRSLSTIVTTSPSLFPGVTGSLLGKSLADLNKAELELVAKVAKKTGWKYTGNGNFENDISNASGLWMTADDRIAGIEIQPESSGTKSRVAQVVEQGIALAAKANSLGGRTMRFALNNLNVANLETFTAFLDNNTRLITQLIKDVKRKGSQRRALARTYMIEPYQKYMRLMAPFTTFNSGNSADTVRKMEIDVVVYDRAAGKAVQRKVWVPIAMAMNLARSEKTQRAMGPKYLLKYGESHGSLVLDDKHFSGGVLTNTDKSILFNQENMKLGAHIQNAEIFETDSKGNLVPVTNPDGSELDNFQFITSNAEINRLIDRFENGIDATPGEVEAFKAGNDFFNIKEVQDMLAEENDKFLNPSQPFKRIPYYSPLNVVTQQKADKKVNSFSPNLEDSKRLNERTGRPDAIFVQDDLRTAQYYMDGVGTVLGSGRLVHNLKQLRDTIYTENGGSLKNAELIEYLDKTIEDLQNFAVSRADALDKTKFTRFANIFLNRNTAFVFRGGIGISLTQISTYFSAAGQGHIKNKYLVRAAPSLVKYTSGAFWDSFTGAGSTVSETNNQGKTNALGMRTIDRGPVEFLLGYGITDPAKKAEHDKLFAVIRDRALNGNNQYVDGVDFKRNPVSSKGIGSQLAKNVDAWFEEKFMAPIRRTDRAVIFSFLEAARLQVADEIKAGVTNDGNPIKMEDYAARVAEITENTIYATNQMSDLTDTTVLQRTNDPFTKMVIVYTGQGQKLFNNLMQTAIERQKFKDDPALDAREKKEINQRFWGAMRSNLLYVPLTVAASRAAWAAMKAVLKGDEPKDTDDIITDIGFDYVRSLGGIIPGWPEQAASFALGVVDDQKWKQGLFEIPGIDVLQTTAEMFLTVGKGVVMGEGGEKLDRQLDQLGYAAVKLGSMFAGVPKIVTDVIYARANPKDQANKRAKAKELAGDSEIEDDFDDDLEPEEELF